MHLLSDIVSLPALDQAIRDGYVRRTLHPEYPYAILNYTEAAQFDNHWDEVTMVCRGLIYQYNTGEIIARGIPKFFNHNQAGAPLFALDDQVLVADKVDGSLGILYPTPDGDFAIATRGSFTSDQALWATEWLHDPERITDEVNEVMNNIKYTGEYENYTELFEIVYPENRVVVNYGDRAELVYLGSVFIPNGYWEPMIDPESEPLTYGEVLSLPPRTNAEGWVLTRVRDGAVVKVKYEDYLELHRAIFGLSARRIWEWELAGTAEANLLGLPDELQPWAITEWKRQVANVTRIERDVWVEFDIVTRNLSMIHGQDWTRKDFADMVKDSPWRAYMFLALDEKDITPVIWRNNKPEAGITPVISHGEDNN